MIRAQPFSETLASSRLCVDALPSTSQSSAYPSRLESRSARFHVSACLAQATHASPSAECRTSGATSLHEGKAEVRAKSTNELPLPDFPDEDLSPVEASSDLDEYQRLWSLGIPLQVPQVNDVGEGLNASDRFLTPGSPSVQSDTAPVFEPEMESVKIPARVSPQALKERARSLSMAARSNRTNSRLLLSETRKRRQLERLAQAAPRDMAGVLELVPPLVASAQVQPATAIPQQPQFPFWKKKKSIGLHPRQLTCRITELKKRRQLGQVFALLEEAKQKGTPPNTIVMNAAMAACVHCGDVERALDLFDEMTSPAGCGVDSITYGTLLKGLGSARRLDDAFELLESMEDGTAPGRPELTEVHLNTLINACADAGDARRARSVLQRFRAFGRGLGPSVLTYNLLIKGYARSDNPLEALSVVEEMQLQGMPLERVSYNSLILACVRGGELERAQDLLQEMKIEAWRQRDPCLWPDTVSYTTLLKGLAADGDLEGVLSLAREMKSGADSFGVGDSTPEGKSMLERIRGVCQLDRVAYSAIIDACLAVGSTADALSFLQEMEQLALADPTMRPRAHVFLSLMRGLAREGAVGEVQDLRGRMARDAGGRVWAEDLWEADELVLEATVAAGQVGEAESLFQSMLQQATRRRGPTNFTERGVEAVVRLSALSEMPTEELKPVKLKTEVAPRAAVEVHMRHVGSLRCLSLSCTRDDLKAALALGQAAVPVLNDAGECVGVLSREHLEQWQELPEGDSDFLERLSLQPPPFVARFALTGDAAALMVAKGAEVLTVVPGSLRHQSGLVRKGTQVKGENCAVGFLFRDMLF